MPLFWFRSFMDMMYTVSNIRMETLRFVTDVTQNDGGVRVKYFYRMFLIELYLEHGGHVD